MTAPLRARAGLGVGAAILAIAAAAGAQKLDIDTTQDPKADFKAIKTYAWLPPPPAIRNVAPDAVTNPTLSEEALGPHLRAAVDRQLAARGWTQAERDVADVHVAYFAAITSSISHTFLGEHYGYLSGWGLAYSGATPSTSATIEDKGALMIDIVQRTSKRAIWSGIVRTKVSQEHTLEKRIARINDGTQRLFQRFPLKPTKR